MEDCRLICIIFVFFHFGRAFDEVIIDTDPEVLTEGNQITVFVSKAEPTGRDLICDVIINPAPAYSDIEEILINDAAPVDFAVHAPRNDEPGDYELTITLACMGQMYREKILVRDTDVIEHDIPQFSQIIVNSRINERQRICFDTKCEPGQYIEMFSAELANLNVLCQFNENQVVNAIKFISPLGNLTISFNHLKYNNELPSIWAETNNINMLRKGGFLVKVNGNLIDLEYIKLSDISFKIMRSKHSKAKYSMNFSIIGLSDYKNIGGLFGRIGNNHFKFYDFLEDGEKFIKGTVLVNGHYTVATKTIGKNKCWSINLEDALHPYQITNFIRKTTF